MGTTLLGTLLQIIYFAFHIIANFLAKLAKHKFGVWISVREGYFLRPKDQIENYIFYNMTDKINSLWLAESCHINRLLVICGLMRVLS